MHLKSLTVRGFKSFASATTFDFEPGVTAVVDPHGNSMSIWYDTETNHYARNRTDAARTATDDGEIENDFVLRARHDGYLKRYLTRAYDDVA